MLDLSSTQPSREQSKPIRPARRWILLAWLAVPLLLWWALRRVPLALAWHSLSGLAAWQILALLAVNLTILMGMALRWWVALRALGSRVSLRALFAYRMAGFAVSFLTPGPQVGGEPLQVYLLHRRHAVQAAHGLASVFLDKLIEMLTNFIFLLLGILVASRGGMLARVPVGWLGVGSLALLALPAGHLAALRLGKRPLSGLAKHLSVKSDNLYLRKASDFISKAEEKMGSLISTRPGALGGMLATSAGVWVLSIGEFFLMLNFLGAPADIPRAIAMLTATRLAFLLPAPGGFGTLDSGLVIAAQLAGFTPAVGLAASMLIHARDFVLALSGLGIGHASLR